MGILSSEVSLFWSMAKKKKKKNYVHGDNSEILESTSDVF